MRAVILVVVLVFVFSASASQNCRCTSEISPVCDLSTHVTFPNECIARCYGRATETHPGRCTAQDQVIERNICPAHLTPDVLSTINNEFHKTTAQILERLVDRLQKNSQRVSRLTSRIATIESSKSIVHSVAAVLQEHDNKQRVLQDKLQGKILLGPDACPQHFKLQFIFPHGSTNSSVVYRRCILAQEQLTFEGPESCEDDQHVLKIDREGLVVRRACVPVSVIGTTQCRKDQILYQHRVGYILRNDCINKCPPGFRIKINPTLSSEVVAYCVFGDVQCPEGTEKHYQVFKKDARILKAACLVPQ